MFKCARLLWTSTNVMQLLPSANENIEEVSFFIFDTEAVKECRVLITGSIKGCTETHSRMGISMFEMLR